MRSFRIVKGTIEPHHVTQRPVLPAHTAGSDGPLWQIDRDHFVRDEQVLRDWSQHEAHPPDLLIVDEAQRAKGLATRTARALKAIGAHYLFALTGTEWYIDREDEFLGYWTKAFIRFRR